MGRAPPICSDGTSLRREAWSQKEDQKHINYISKNGHGKWKPLPNHIVGYRSQGDISSEEEKIIVKLHKAHGNKIATELPRRTDNEIKNYWNTHLRRKLIQDGIDPKTHKPLFDPNFLTMTTSFPQLPSPSNLTNAMSPWEIVSVRSAIELAKLEVLQSITQVQNTSVTTTVSSVETIISTLMATHYSNRFEGINYNDVSLVPLEFPNKGMNPSYENLINPYERLLPPLVTVSGECSVNSNESNINPTGLSTLSHTSTIFESLEKFLLDDDEAISFLMP
ncbi:hypothetical protein NMG60_11030094 [Bertholletia excelsa]